MGYPFKMRQFLTSLVKRFMPKDVHRPLGRWGNEYCDTKTNFKIDLSNEDHCGPCGQYVMLKKEDMKSAPTEIRNLTTKTSP